MDLLRTVGPRGDDARGPPVRSGPEAARRRQGDPDSSGRLLRWVAARGATGYELFFGPADEPARGTRLDAATTSWSTGPLAAGTRYAWRVDAISPEGRVRGETWSFTTAARPFRIALAGDSTVTDRQGWGTGFAPRLGAGATCANHARGGRSTKSFVEEGHWEKVLSERPDVVLIQFGHNDAPGKGPERETDAFTTYRENLARMIDEARAAGARPVLLTPLTRRYVDEAGCVRSDLGFYADAVRAVAVERRVPLLDLHRLSVEAVDRMSPAEVVALGVPKEDGTLDRTHLSAQGSALFGGLVAEELGRVIPDLGVAFQPDGAPGASADSPPAARGPSGDAGDPIAGRTATSKEKGVAGVRSLLPLLERPTAWFSTAEAARIGESLLLFQRSNGGWPKNVDMTRALPPREREALLRHREDADTTIDNGATYTQVRFLARLFAAARDERFRKGALDGIDFLLAAQYPNGGWPQFFPLRDDYSRHVTFNDGAMAGRPRRSSSTSRRGASRSGSSTATAAPGPPGPCEKGVAAILASQVVTGGTRTAWCAQHDEKTLAPRPARTFEPVALASSESVGVVRFLMSLPAPSREVVAAVDAAVAWLRSVQDRRPARRAPANAGASPAGSTPSRRPTRPRLPSGPASTRSGRIARSSAGGTASCGGASPRSSTSGGPATPGTSTPRPLSSRRTTPPGRRSTPRRPRR